MKTVFTLATFVAAALPTSTSAHHSFAMFDQSREVKLVGVVREFQYTNPHIWIQVVVPKSGSKPATEWSIEGASVNTVKRMGWNRSIIKPGDKVTVIINPMKNGDNGGSLKSITLPDGKVLGRSG